MAYELHVINTRHNALHDGVPRQLHVRRVERIQDEETDVLFVGSVCRLVSMQSVQSSFPDPIMNSNNIRERCYVAVCWHQRGSAVNYRKSITM